MKTSGSRDFFRASDVPSEAHSSMKYPDHADSRLLLPVHDHVRANKVKPVRFGKLRGAVPYGRISADGLEGLVDLVKVDVKLALLPRFARVAEDIDEVLSRPWREDDLP